MTDLNTTPIDPYASLLDLTSTGRVSLAFAITHFCALHWGSDERQVAAALAEESDDADAAAVRGAAATLGRVFAAGGARTWARPIGGGPSVTLDAEMWELDDWKPRFRRSALALKRPWDPSAEPTHWIFVDAEDWDRIAAASCAEVFGPRRSLASDSPNAVHAQDVGEPGGCRAADGMRLLRLPEVKAMTGLSRSSIYAKMPKGTFPVQVEIGGAMVAWREGAVLEWLRDPR